MVNTSAFFNGLKYVLVYNIIIILTVTCNYTIAVFENDIAMKEGGAVSRKNIPQIKANKKDSGSEQVDVDDGKIYNNGIPTAQTKDSIQLGILYAVNGITNKPKRKVLFPNDFTDSEIAEFKNMLYTNHTSAVHHLGFTFTTYAPFVFHYFRDLFKIQQDYYLNLSHDSPLHELSDPGARTSIFYITQDNKFIMKSLQSAQLQSIQKLLPKYSKYMEKNPSSLLPKFSGLYGYKRKAIDMKLLSMNNLLPSNIKMHLKYDLKGSTFHRAASINEKLKKSPIFKDLDFDEDYLNGIFLMPNTISQLLKSIKSDCDFLQNFNLTNYSLLLGVHKIDKDNSTCSQAADARFTRLMVNSTGMESIQEDTGTYPAEKNCPSLGGSIPAKSGWGERLLLFVGIIDILQDYGFMEKIEKNYKTIKIELTPGMPSELSSISVQPPDVYASRFLEFMTKSVFKPILISKH